MVVEARAPLRDGPQRDVIGIIAALALERRSLERGLRRDVSARAVILQSGPGLERAAAAARRAIRSGATCLVSWGLAGGLVEEARPCSVLIPDRVVLSDGREVAVDLHWRKELVVRLRGEFDLLEGSLVSVEEVLATPAAKSCSALVSGAVAADMESGAVASVAAEAGVPFLAVRVVADGAADVLPREVAAWISPQGTPRLSPLLRTLLEPRELGRLATLARRSRAAERVLVALARSAIGQPGLLGSRVATIT